MAEGENNDGRGRVRLALGALRSALGFVPDGRRRLAVRERARLGLGKVRRFLYHSLRPRKTAGKLELRRGECRSCGACCRLLFRCPHLIMEHGKSSCRVYERRPQNCRVFPMDRYDLGDRDVILPERVCGFRFEP